MLRPGANISAAAAIRYFKQIAKNWRQTNMPRAIAKEAPN
jgi:hypothetical protein